MNDLHIYNNKVWDRLFDLLYACDQAVSDTEVDAELQLAGIDMRPAFLRLREMMDQRTARRLLAQARETRQSMMAELRGVVGPKIADLRKGVQEFIGCAFSGPEQVAHYHKLEKAATEEDLRSLMDDLTSLAKLRQTEDKKDKNVPKAK